MGYWGIGGLGQEDKGIGGNVLFGGSGDRGSGYLDDQGIWTSEYEGLGIGGSGIARSGIREERD